MHGIIHRPIGFGVITFLTISIVVVGLNWAEEGHAPVKVLALPFSLLTNAEDVDFKSFADHATATVNATLDSMGKSVNVIPEDAYAGLLKRTGPLKDDQEAIRIGLTLETNMVVFGFLSREDNFYRMRGVMWDLAANRSTVATDVRVENIHALPGALNVFAAAITKRLTGAPKLEFYKSEGMATPSTPPSQKPSLVSAPGRSSQASSPWRSPDMSVGICSITIGDLDGDGKQETVFLDENGITISRFEGGGLRPLTRYSQAPAIYVSAEAVDLDGDGVCELILCYRTFSGFESAIIQYKDRNLTVAEKITDVVLKVISEPMDGKEEQRLLVGQRVDGPGVFNGKVRRYKFEGGKLQEIGEIDLPPGTFLLSYASGYFKPENQFLRIILNQDQRLMAFDSQNRLMATMPDRIFGLQRRVRFHRQGQPPIDISMPGRILITHGQTPGQNDVLVVKQSESGSTIEALGWEGMGFLEKWRTVNSPGVISDYLVGDFKNDKTNSLVLALVNPMFFQSITGYRTVIFAYDLGM